MIGIEELVSVYQCVSFSRSGAVVVKVCWSMALPNDVRSVAECGLSRAVGRVSHNGISTPLFVYTGASHLSSHPVELCFCDEVTTAV